MKALYDVLAPAKLNLFLHITGRRADGYHLLQSVFMLIDWCDRLHFEVRTDGVISRSDTSALALPADDLCVRAARALQAATGTHLGAHIHLEKHIPAQAGMGGGSSDAASCLLALQRLWGVRLPADQLGALALGLGADVPFFLFGSHAWVEGVGEQLSPITLPPARFWVIKPASGLSTPAIFGSPVLKRDSEAATILSFAAHSSDQIFEFGRNDLQPVAQQICPDISQALECLSAQGLKGRMTGSGSAVFALIPPEISAGIEPNACFSGLPDQWQARPCSNLEMHPLAGW
jgi:4-diphosphocytidyl-2-C-methyl-D-erythritol kinase